MCGRYTLAHPAKINERYGTRFPVYTLSPNYNVAPSQTLPVIVAGEQGNEVRMMKWGLVPSWSKEPRTQFSTTNARAEGLEDSRLYQTPLKKRRCIIPADGFFEWQRQDGAKIPHYISLVQEDLFSFAGLYEVWHEGQADELATYTIITTAPNELMEPIHNRMPVILQQQHEEPWLDPNISDPNLLYSFLKPYPASYMQEHIVSTSVNNVRNNEAELIGPINSK